MISRLRRYRLALGLTQAQASERARCSVPTWRRAERGGSWLTVSQATSLFGAGCQSWYTDGDLEQGRELCRRLAEGKDSAEMSRLEAYLLPEPGRFLFLDGGEWVRVIDSFIHGGKLYYETSQGAVGVEFVRSVALAIPSESEEK